MDFNNKNDYSITVYNGKDKRLFTEYVHNVFKYSQWLETKSIQWTYLLVYVRRSRAILCYYKNGDFIHAKPTPERCGRIKKWNS